LTIKLNAGLETADTVSEIKNRTDLCWCYQRELVCLKFIVIEEVKGEYQEAF